MEEEEEIRVNPATENKAQNEESEEEDKTIPTVVDESEEIKSEFSQGKPSFHRPPSKKDP